MRDLQREDEEEIEPDKRVGLPHREFKFKVQLKIGGIELFPKFELTLARAFSSDISLALATLIPNFTPFLSF